MVASYDPATGEWAQLGSGLSSLSFPEVRMAVDGNDVYIVGDFQFIGIQNQGDKAWASNFIARWNETVDFTKNPAKVADKPEPSPKPAVETESLAEGNLHWSRAFPPPPRRKRPDQLAHTGATGMDVGAGPPETAGLVWLDDTLYFAGNYPATPQERWFVWSYHAERGWERLAWDERGKATGPDAPPDGIKVHDGKVWVYGGIPAYKGVASYDPKTKQWTGVTGTYAGRAVMGHAMEQGGGAVRDIAWDSKTGDFYMAGASGLENPDYQYPGDVSSVIRVDKDGNFHPMGHKLMPEDPKKPVKVVQTIHLDESQDPTAIYVGGTFNFYGGAPTRSDRQAFNVVRWDHQAQDWAPIGKGAKVQWVDRERYPEGYPGLPARPDTFGGFLQGNFPRVMDLITDADGNLYAGGTLALLDDTMPVMDRVESFGIAKYDRATDTWVAPTKMGGFSRDVLQMSWLDEAKTQLLLTGAFEYGNDWTPLNGVAVLDTTTGEVAPLGGGLMMAHRDQVVAPMIRHAVKGEEIWFAGLFDHAGINANARLETPNPSSFVALWNPAKEFKPADGSAAPKAAAKPAAGGEALPKSIAYKVEQIEKDLAKAEKAIAEGNGRSAKRPVDQVERNLKDIGRRGAPMDHPRIAEAVKRLDAIKSQIK